MHASRINDIWKRFGRFFEQRGETLERLGFFPGIRQEIIPAAEAKMKLRFPADYREFLLLCGGHDYERLNWMPDNMSLLTLDDVVKTWENDHFFNDDKNMEEYYNRFDNDGKTRMVFYHPKRIPVAGAEEEGSIYIDMAPGPSGREGQVIEIVENIGLAVLADSFESFLDAYATKLERGELVFNREAGAEGEYYRIRTAGGRILTAGCFVSLFAGERD